MALPLLYILGTTLVRAAGPAIARELVKLGAKKATQEAAKRGGAKLINKDNIGVVKTISRPKTGGAAPKTTPKTTSKPKAGASATTTPKKPTGSGRNATRNKKPTTKKAPTLKTDPKNAPTSVAKRRAAAAAKKKKADAAKKAGTPLTGTKAQRGIIVAATALPMFMDTKPKGTATAKTDTSRKEYRPSKGTSKEQRLQADSARAKAAAKNKTTNGESFGAAFKKAYGKGVGTKFTHKGKSYTAVKDTDLKKSGSKSLREYLNKKKGKK